MNLSITSLLVAVWPPPSLPAHPRSPLPARLPVRIAVRLSARIHLRRSRNSDGPLRGRRVAVGGGHASSGGAAGPDCRQVRREPRLVQPDPLQHVPVRCQHPHPQPPPPPRQDAHTHAHTASRDCAQDNGPHVSAGGLSRLITSKQAVIRGQSNALKTTHGD